MKGSMFAAIPPNLPDELFEILASAGDVEIERIVSRGHASPPDFWYDQNRDEFVLLVKGRAGISIEGRSELIVLAPGDYLMIEAHVRHRVEWTDPDMDTIWLAVHCSAKMGNK